MIMLTRWRTEITVFVLLVYMHISQQHEIKIKRLRPDATVFDEVLYHQESAYYLLSNLKPNFRYELRVSYPATTPTEFVISLEGDTDKHGARKLLNIEKLVFLNEPAKLDQLAKVTAMRTGVPRDMKRLADPVVYNIVLETLYLGLPLEVWKMGVVVLLIVGFVIKFAVPWMLDFLDKMCVRTKKARE